MRNLISATALLLSVLSCSESQKPQPNGHALKSDIRAGDVQESQTKEEPIISVLNKIENQKELKNADYEIVSDFLLKNYDESLSEGVGYSLHEYLKDNSAHNYAYSAFLNKKETAYRETILAKLIAVMCIDLGEDNYNYDRLIKAFSIFEGSVSAQKEFKACMDNQ